MAIQKFKDLIVWQQAKELAVLIYNITKTFPQTERYGITDQSRRASVSIAANIAEGFGSESSKGKLRYYHYSRASLFELESHIDIAQELGYVQPEAYTQLVDQMKTVRKLLSGLINRFS